MSLDYKKENKSTNYQEDDQEYDDKAIQYRMRRELIDVEEYYKSESSRYIILEDYVTHQDINELDTENRDLTILLKQLINDYNHNVTGIESIKETIEFKKYIDSTTIHKLSLGHFIINLIMWSPIFRLGKLPKMKKDIIQPTIMNNKVWEKFMNKIIIRYRQDVTSMELSKYMSESYDYVRLLLQNMELEGYSFSIYDIIMAGRRNPKLKEVLDTQIDVKNHRFDQTEKYLKDQTEKFLEYTMDDKEFNDLKPMILAGEGVNTKQLRESVINIGFKPNLKGQTIPITQNTNILKGINTVESLFVDASGGKKAMYLQKSVNKALFMYLLVINNLYTNIKI